MTPFVDQVSNIRAAFARPFQPPVDCGGVTDCDWTLHGATEMMRPAFEYCVAGLCLFGLITALLKARNEGPSAAFAGMMTCVVGAFLLWTVPQLSPEHFALLILPVLILAQLAPFAAAIWLAFRFSRRLRSTFSKKAMRVERVADGKGL